MTKKLLFILMIVFLLEGALVVADAFSYNAPLEWKAPELMGQGGSATANVRGYDALFTNPAGFRTEKGEINILTLQPYWNVHLFELLSTLKGTEDSLEFLLKELTSNGVGAGFQTSFGYVGRGLGLGFFASIDSYFPKTGTTLGVNGNIWITSGFVGGYALGFDLGEWTLRVGADFRPMYRLLVNDLSVKKVLQTVKKDEDESVKLPLLQGFGFGFDLGVQGEYRFLTLGLSVRDIATNFFYDDGEMPLTDLGNIDTLGNSDAKYATPTTLRLGAAVHPDLGGLSKVLDSQAHAELAFPLVDGEDYKDYKVGSLLTRLNFGAELTLLRFAALRVGLNGGYLTVGFGFDLPVFKLNLAFYTQEKGTYAGNEPSIGGALEISFRL